MSLHTKMLIGFVLGTLSGLGAHWLDIGSILTYGVPVASFIGQIFLRLLLMLVLPLIVSALILGISEVGDLKNLGRMGLVTILCVTALSLSSVVLGMGFVWLFKPGEGLDEHTVQALLQQAQQNNIALGTHADFGGNILVHLIPTNIVAAASSGDILGVMVFALLFGIAMTGIASTQTKALRDVLNGVFEVSMRLCDIVLRMGPYAIFCLIFAMMANFGLELMLSLGRYVGTVLLAMALHYFGVYSFFLSAFARMNPWRFFRNIQEAAVTAFATASSNATLPTALKVAEEDLQLHPEAARFVLTIGATANQNGTALFEGITVLFLAQVFGVELSWVQQLLVLGIAVLGGIGTAGVPAGSLPVIAAILATIGVPVEGIGLILGIDRFLDMCRTSLNVAGDLVVASIVSRSEDKVRRR
jgi:DAACS family dicarboxylate/amino acid:cation (Na+ or H+) symporter